jgi:hypothetical protein
MYQHAYIHTHTTGMARLQKPANRSSPHRTTPALSVITLPRASAIGPPYTRPQSHTNKGGATQRHFSTQPQREPPHTHRHEPPQSSSESVSRLTAVPFAVHHCRVAPNRLRRHESAPTSESESSTHVYCRLSSGVYAPQRRQLGRG